METQTCYLNSNAAQNVVFVWDTAKITRQRSQRSYQLLVASNLMAMEQRQRTTTVLVRSKLKVKFPFEGGSVDVCKPAQKLI